MLVSLMCSATADDLALLPANFPVPGLQATPQLENDAGVLPGIHLNGINISIDEDLLIDAPGGQVAVENSTLSVSSEEGKGGSITLTGEEIAIDGNSQLLATGPEGGGLIQLGGSWQNSDPSVRQAVKATVESGAVLDASATDHGDGGEIVVWSDIAIKVIDICFGSFLCGELLVGTTAGLNFSADLEIAGVDISTNSVLGDQAYGCWIY